MSVPVYFCCVSRRSTGRRMEKIMRLGRRTGPLALSLLLLVAAAGCAKPADSDGVATAGNGASPTASPSAAAGFDKDAGLRLAQCMRENGVPNFPDPQLQEGGGTRLIMPEGVSPQDADAAMQKCKQYAPNGGTPPKLNPEQVERARQMAKCMRANGVPNFPDPGADGRLSVNLNDLGLTPDDPKMKAAEEACKQFRPSGPPPQTDRNDG